jgi:hypothetical protein
MILSTGSRHTLLDWRQLDSLGLRARNIVGILLSKRDTRGLNVEHQEKRRISMVTIDSLKIDQAVGFKHVESRAVDFSLLEDSRLGESPPGTQGLLGPEFLQRWNALIDCSSRVVYLSK